MSANVIDSPRYVHDCDEDIYLGQCERYDLWFADHGGFAPGYTPDTSTVIARYGNEGSEYLSGIPAAKLFAPIGEGLDRAIEKGLIKKNG